MLAGFNVEAVSVEPTGPGAFTEWLSYHPTDPTVPNWEIVTQDSPDPSNDDAHVYANAGDSKDLYSINWNRPTQRLESITLILYATNWNVLINSITPIISVNGTEIAGAVYMPVTNRDPFGALITSVPAVSTVFNGPFKPTSKDWFQAGFSVSMAGGRMQVWKVAATAQNSMEPGLGFARRGYLGK